MIEQTNLLRVGVSVPQGYSSDVRIGQRAELLVSNFPGKSFEGTVARTAGSIDPGTRTLRVEVDVPNAQLTLLPGMYGQVRFHVKRDTPTLILPTSALVYSPKGMTIAVIESGHAKIKTVALGRDFGQEAEIITGLAASDVVINNPGLITEGTAVEIKPTPPPVSTPK
jgi:RND family efflux transporter MFP subunit